MKGLEPEQTAEYLGVVHSLRPRYPLCDMHVHPYEVLFDRFTYDEEEYSRPGVVSLPGKSYTTPSARSFQFPEISNFGDDPRSKRLQDISVMLLRKVYGNVGGQVFSDQMALSGIDRVLLLPVAPESGTPAAFDSRMRWVKRLYGDEEKFWIAGSVPGALKGRELSSYVRTVKREYGIRAIKCHPVVSGLDLSGNPGKEWLELLLAACHESDLPLVLHGGRNNPYWGGSRGNFAALEHLAKIDMSVSQKPIILAHAGFHWCDGEGIRREGLPMLERMLQAYPNLYVDISGLTFGPLKLVLRYVNGERILFGSDALYSSQWEAVTMTMHALKELGMSLEANFARFASINPRKTIFKDLLPC